MSKVAAEIAVKVGADTIGIEAGMRRAGDSVANFDNRAKAMAVNFARIGARVVSVGAAIGVGLAAMGGHAARSAKEIDNLARISGVGAEQFQKLAIAGSSVGLSSEKLADIFKDVNDKFGDFLENGAGPLKDFFVNIAPQVGVTADQFARLSGPEALQLYVSSLEQAGVSQQQMTFYMEALASDATALVPLLQNNGREMGRLGEYAARTGQIMSNETVRAGADLDRKLTEVANTIRTKVNTALLENSELIVKAADLFANYLIPALSAVVSAASSVAAAIEGIVAQISAATAAVAGFYEKAQAFVNSKGLDIYGVTGIEKGQEPAWLLSLQGRQPTPDAPAQDPELSTTLLRSGRSEMTTVEQIRELNAEKIAVQEEFQNESLASAGGYSRAMENIEAKSMETRAAAMNGALGDLSSLMSSHSSTLFKIGKKAAIAQALIDARQSVVAAWKHGMTIGGPPLAAVFAGASALKTASMISSLQSSTQSGGGGGVGAGGGAGGATVSKVVNLTIAGDSVPRSQMRSLVSRLNEEIANGARINVV